MLSEYQSHSQASLSLNNMIVDAYHLVTTFPSPPLSSSLSLSLQRSDYLHRKLYEAVSHLPNVYFPTWRMATIWGGASLLQMLLRALEDLEFVLTDWNWDFFINLSESDYPIK